jgi:hypothetical protein
MRLANKATRSLFALLSKAGALTLTLASNVSRPGSAAAWTASTNPALARAFLSRRPRPSEPLINVGANHPSDDLRGSEILMGAQFLEDCLLAWINQDRQTRGTLFELYDCLVLHLH